MAQYLIGDIQGCFQSFQKLLQQIRFHPEQDRIYCLGDLVNRGPESLATLRFIVENEESIHIILGNHDIHLLNCYYNKTFRPQKETFLDILNAADAPQLINWLYQQPLCRYLQPFDLFMSHAGLYPRWTVQKALELNQEFCTAMLTHQNNPATFLSQIYGNQPDIWSEDLKGIDRIRFIVNAFTRMRLLKNDNQLDLSHKESLTTVPDGLKPWFYSIKPEKTTIAFGHWAALEGKIPENTPLAHQLFALDTGCVWGGKLTALCIDSGKIFQV